MQLGPVVVMGYEEHVLYLREATGADRKVAEDGQCLDFGTFAKTWSAGNGGSCSLGVEYIEAHGAPVRTYTKP